MGMADLAQKGVAFGDKQARGWGIKKYIYNAVGEVCTRNFSSEKGQNRCKAVARLYDIAKSGTAAAGSCGVVAGAALADVGTAGLATPVAAPVGIGAAASCGYNGFATGDSAVAMGRQLVTGKETKTLQEQATEKALKVGGAYVEKKKEEVKEAYEAYKNAPPKPPQTPIRFIFPTF